MELFSFYLKLKNIFYYLFSRQKIENKWYSQEFFSFHSLPSIIYLPSSPPVFLTSFPSPIRHAFFPSLSPFLICFLPFTSPTSFMHSFPHFPFFLKHILSSTFYFLRAFPIPPVITPSLPIFPNAFSPSLSYFHIAFFPSLLFFLNACFPSLPIFPN